MVAKLPGTIFVSSWEEVNLIGLTLGLRRFAQRLKLLGPIQLFNFAFFGSRYPPNRTCRTLLKRFKRKASIQGVFLRAVRDGMSAPDFPSVSQYPRLVNQEHWPPPQASQFFVISHLVAKVILEEGDMDS